MSIEEHRMATEPVEKLEEVFLDNSKLDRTTKIGTLANPTVRQALTTFSEVIGTSLPGVTRTCLG